MADETNRFNVCLQAKRFKTATVKAKILDTDRLNHIGLDMSEWRCKDLAKIKYLKKSTTISLSNFCDVKKNGSDRQEAESPESASNSVSTKLSSQSGAQSNSKMFDSSGDFPNNNKPRNNASSGLACSTCQPSAALDAKKEEEPPSKQSYLSRFVKFGIGLQRRNKNETTSSFIEENKSNSNNIGNFSTSFDRNHHFKSIKNFNPVIRTPPPPSSLISNPPTGQSSSSGWLSFIEYRDPIGEGKEKAEEAFRQRLRKCNFCGNEFGTAGFKIHQPRCFQAKLLEDNMREETSNAVYVDHQKGNPAMISPTPVFRPVICYICKRQFGSQSIAIHQPQCLRKWQLNNEKLSPNFQKAEPSPR